MICFTISWECMGNQSSEKRGQELPHLFLLVPASSCLYILKLYLRSVVWSFQQWERTLGCTCADFLFFFVSFLGRLMGGWGALQMSRTRQQIVRISPPFYLKQKLSAPPSPSLLATFTRLSIVKTSFKKKQFETNKIFISTSNHSFQPPPHPLCVFIFFRPSPALGAFRFNGLLAPQRLQERRIS